MSYIRFGADSDVYLIGTYRNGLRVIECCGCKLNTEMRDLTEKEREEIRPLFDPEGLQYSVHPDPSFTTAVGACKHLDEHRDAGHQVPEEAYDNVLDDDGWLDGADGDRDVPAGEPDGNVREQDGPAEEEQGPPVGSAGT